MSPCFSSGLWQGQMGHATFVSWVFSPWVRAVRAAELQLDAEHWGWQCSTALCPWWQDLEPLVLDKESALLFLALL